MRKQFSQIFVIIALSWALLAGLVFSAQAQEPAGKANPAPAAQVTATPASVEPPATATPASEVPAPVNENSVTFTQLGQAEIELNGPYESYTLLFAPPSSWDLTDGASLNLSAGITFSELLGGQSTDLVFGGGTLTISLNDVILAVLQLTNIGEVTERITIPITAFESTRPDGLMALRFFLDTGVSCRIGGSRHAVVFVHPTTFLTIPHNIVNPPTTLINFPRPIYQSSFVTDSALLIIPNEPSAEELQAAFTVAAGLGNLSSNSMTLDLTTLDEFNSELSASTVGTTNDLIFVGKASAFPVLETASLPLPPSDGQFSNPGGNQDDGIVEMVVSPWSNANVLLVVSGNTDQGVVKSAQAISTGVLRPNRFENLAVIEQVNLTPVTSPQAVDRTLRDLGYPGTLFQSRGVSSDIYEFNVPAGMTVSPESFFEVIYGHSALIDYNRSQIVVLLNDQPIGSVRMSDTTASISTNHVRISIPPSAVVPGNNRLEMRVNIVPIDDCTPPNIQGLWINIWPDSTLHLPLTAASVSPIVPQNLGEFPAPFIYDPVLGSTAFVLEHNDLPTWRNALQIAAFLGFEAGGQLTELSVFYGDEVPEAQRAKYNLIVIGRPSQMPIVDDLNSSLPAPFSSDSDIASEDNLQVKYRIPADSPMGYVETLVSPWNSTNTVLAVLGNTTQGVNWAAFALVDPVLRGRLGGNFAVVNDRQIITTDTSQPSGIGGSISTQTANQPGAPITPPGSGQAARPGWIIPVLVVLIILIVLVLIGMVVRNRARNSNRDANNTE